MRRVSFVLVTAILAACAPAGHSNAPTSLHVVASFDAGESASARPPDAALAAGNGELLEATNSGVHLLTPRGDTVGAPASLLTFFGPVLERGDHVTDPRAAWDPAGRRFLLSAFTYLRRPPCQSQAQCGDRFLLAISRSASPGSLDPAAWEVAALPMSSGPGEAFIQSIDFPSLGVTRDAIVVTANAEALLPGNTSGISHVRVRLIDRAAAEGGLRGVRWHDLDDLRDPDGHGATSNVMPVMGSDAVLLASTWDDCRVRIWQVADPLGTPRATAAFAGPAGSCGPALNASQPGRAASLEVDSVELHSRPWFRDGRVWLAQTVAGPARLAQVRWIEVDVSAFPAAREVAEGRLSTPGASTFEGAPVAGPGRSLLVVFASSGTNARQSVRVTGRAGGDAAGTLRPPVVLRLSDAVQQTAVADPSQRNRFGDYYDASPDPGGRSAWVLGEYIRAPEQWSMWMARVDFPV